MAERSPSGGEQRRWLRRYRRRTDAPWMSVQCAKCGTSSEIDELFPAVRRSFSRRTRRMCPACLHRRRFQESAWGHRATLAVFTACALLIALRPESHVAGVALGLAMLLLASIPAMLLHEVGHAAMGRLLGLRSIGIVVGCGRSVWRGSLLGMPIEWRAIPVGAITRGALVSAEGARWRMALFAVAGPAVNALAVAVTWPALPDFTVSRPALALGEAVAIGWVGANGLHAVVNLIPFRHTNALGLLASDGLLIVQALRAKPEIVREWLRARFLLEWTISYEDVRLQDALESVREGLASYPDDPQLTSLLGVALVQTGDCEGARDAFRCLLGMDPSPVDRALALSNLAWCDFLSGRDERLDEALQCSQEAFEQLGWMPPVQNTRAAVLVWADRASEALPLVLRSYRGAEAPTDRATVACVVALAYASIGRRDEAKHALEQARDLDATCPLLPRAEAAVSGARPGGVALPRLHPARSRGDPG